MPTTTPQASRADDAELAGLVAQGDHRAFESLMRRHNGKLFRVARAILKDDADAEEALQDAYLDAYRHMGDYAGAAKLETWLTRIVINQALMRLRKRKRDHVIVPFAATDSTGHADRDEDAIPDTKVESPSSTLFRGEIRRLLEQRIDELPTPFRVAFVMREVEEMSTEEIAECLAIPVATVRTRLFRARALLRQALAREVDLATTDVFRFDGERCDRIVAHVLAALQNDR
jgi:RNA polymerase sigma-70 factor (ECF subfamily)